MKTRVAVVYGGRSGEHEVSLVSAASVIAAMNPERFDVVRYVIAKDGRWSPGPILPEPGANVGIDVVFLAECAVQHRENDVYPHIRSGLRQNRRGWHDAG